MKLKRKVFIEKGQLDIAPLMDVMFLLLIFFMLTSSFIFQPGIRVNLPKAVTSEVLQRELLVVTVTESNEIFINERPVPMSELSSRIAIAAKSELPILIKADKTANLGSIIKVWDLCRKFEIKQINIATTQQ